MTDVSEEARQRSIARFEERKRQARLEGQFARLHGRPGTDNPHPPGSEISQLWAGGWKEMGNDD